MTSTFLSTIWESAGPAMVNHLWQSTLCFAVAGFLVRVLRNNRARARYGVWLAASVKFLVPFSLLTAIGAHFAPPRVISQPGTGVFDALLEVTQPLQPLASPLISTLANTAFSFHWFYFVAGVAAAAWVCGFIVLLLAWYADRQRVSGILRGSVPLREGREIEILRRLGRLAGLRGHIDVLLIPAAVEPGVLGIFRPVLVWPARLSDRLDDAHLEAVLGHEVWHVCRRDNVAAAIHMLVESLFWFHPAVWLLRARLVEERERACDEAVLAAGNNPRIYAESILKTCQFCVEPPLADVSGIIGGGLKKRIVRIVDQPSAVGLGAGKKLLLAAIAAAAIAGPVIFGLANAPVIATLSLLPDNANIATFDFTSIHPSRTGSPNGSVANLPDRLAATNATTMNLIERAYGVRDFRIINAPDWIRSDRYDVDAEVMQFNADEWRKLTPLQQQMRKISRLQSLLARRFNLRVSRQTQELPIYTLMLANKGPSLRTAKPGDTYPGGIKGADGRPLEVAGEMRGGQGWVTGQGIPMSRLALLLTEMTGRTVIDQTSLAGKYDLTLRFSYDPTGVFPDVSSRGPEELLRPNASRPPLAKALEEQLGLKLELTEGPMEVLVIDHIEKPVKDED